MKYVLVFAILLTSLFAFGVGPGGTRGGDTIGNGPVSFMCLCYYDPLFNSFYDDSFMTINDTGQCIVGDICDIRTGEKIETFFQ